MRSSTSETHTVHNSQTATTTSSLAASAISRDRSHILNAADLHTLSCKSPQSTLRTGSWGSRFGSTGCSKFDVQSINAEILATVGHILCRQHRSVWGRLVSICLDLHATSDTDECFSARQIGDMNKSIIERGENVSHSKHILVVALLRFQGHCLHFLSNFFRRHLVGLLRIRAKLS